MKKVVIAGGTGFIGQKLENYLVAQGYEVKILTRKPVKEHHVFWNPAEQQIDAEHCSDTQVLINLCGENLNAKRWTRKQKQLLVDSRVQTTRLLYELRQSFPNLEQYITASGITAYGFDDGKREHPESDPYGNDFLSQLVNEWEQAADLFASTCRVTKLRIAVVFEKEYGALQKMSAPVKMGIGAPLATGKQQIPWVHSTDLVRLIEFAIVNELEGTYNTNAGNVSNKELTTYIAASLNKKLWLPNIPAFVLKMVLGDMAEMVVCGAKASNEKISGKGFVFNYRSVPEVLR